jgi:hypothetical protein
VHFQGCSKFHSLWLHDQTLNHKLGGGFKVQLSCSNNWWFKMLIMWSLRVKLWTPLQWFFHLFHVFLVVYWIFSLGGRVTKRNLWIINDSIINWIICNHVKNSKVNYCRNDNMCYSNVFMTSHGLLMWKNMCHTYRIQTSPWGDYYLFKKKMSQLYNAV